MNPPTPAAVRAAMKFNDATLAPEEARAFRDDNRWSCKAILRDHIRAVAAEMRAEANAMSGYGEHDAVSVIRAQLYYANKLEGRES